MGLRFIITDLWQCYPWCSRRVGAKSSTPSIYCTALRRNFLHLVEIQMGMRRV